VIVAYSCSPDSQYNIPRVLFVVVVVVVCVCGRGVDCVPH